MAELFPRRVVSIDPPRPGSNTISNPYFGELDDGLSYCIKHDGQGWPVRASEFLATELCGAIGMAVPPYKIAEMPDGAINFASQILHDRTTTDAWLLAAIPIHRGTEQLSKVYAFDLFSCNDDRHAKNFLVRSQNSVDRLFVMDFSHTFFAKWPQWPDPPLLPVTPSRNTVDVGRMIRRSYGFSEAAAVGCLDEISRIDCDTIKAIMAAMPRGWLQNDVSSAFVKWWCEGGKDRRIQLLEKGLRDGTLL